MEVDDTGTDVGAPGADVTGLSPGIVTDGLYEFVGETEEDPTVASVGEEVGVFVEDAKREDAEVSVQGT